MKRIVCTTLLAAAAGLPAVAGEADRKGPDSVYDFEMKAIDGQSVKLSKYQGDVLMIVNVASK